MSWALALLLAGATPAIAEASATEPEAPLETAVQRMGTAELFFYAQGRLKQLDHEAWICRQFDSYDAITMHRVVDYRQRLIELNDLVRADPAYPSESQEWTNQSAEDVVCISGTFGRYDFHVDRFLRQAEVATIELERRHRATQPQRGSEE